MSIRKFLSITWTTARKPKLHSIAVFTALWLGGVSRWAHHGLAAFDTTHTAFGRDFPAALTEDIFAIALAVFSLLRIR